MLLRQAIVGGFDWVDLETDVADQVGRFKDVKRIISYHNLREVPAELEEIHEKMCRQDPDVVKLAVTAQRPTDNLRVLKLLGLGLATAIFVDATVVRMVLVPATMELLGNANWWLPKWLDRVVPRVSVEAPTELLPEPELARSGVRSS